MRPTTERKGLPRKTAPDPPAVRKASAQPIFHILVFIMRRLTTAEEQSMDPQQTQREREDQFIFRQLR